MTQITEQNSFASRNAHQLLRLLVASYFIGEATGVIPFQPGRDLAAMLLPAGIADFAFTAFVLTASFLIIIRRHVRVAALLLAVFVFWASYLASYGPNPTLGAVDFWRDLVLIGSLFLTYLSHSTGAQSIFPLPRARSTGRKVTPRRISVTPTRRPSPTPILAAPKPFVPSAHPGFSQDPDDLANIFAQVFDQA